MSLINKLKTAVRTYQAPDCEACGIDAGAVICDSLTDASTEDWVYDETGF